MSNWSSSSIWPRTPRRRRGIWNYPRPYRTGIRAWVPSWRFFVGTMLTGISLTAGVFIAAWMNLTVPAELDSVDFETTTVYYSDGEVLGKYAAQNRTVVPFEELPKHLSDAIIASEDQTYETHPGINVLGIARAIVNNLSGGNLQGASTITQQYVENYYYGVGEANLDDKFREAIIALKVTREQSKDEVLEGYLNTIYLGRGTYGVEAASQAYFGHSAREMTLSESAFLAGIIPNPTYWDPRQGELSQARADYRWNRTLDFMVEMGSITQADREAAKFPTLKKYTQGSGNSQTTYLLQAIAKELADPDGANLSEDQLNTGGYVIKTTLNSKMQAAAAKAMELPENADPRIRASLTSIDPSSGEIRALYGGPDYSVYQTNSATQDIAQAGSTFKPFALVAGLEKNIPLTRTYDGTSPQEIEGYTTWNAETEQEEQAVLTNFGNAPYGASYPNVTLLKATIHSVNTAYVHLNKEVGPQSTRDVAIRAGIPETNAAGREIVAPNLANVLGTASVRNIDLAHAYSTFAAQGKRTTPHLIAEVFNGDTLLYEGDVSQTTEFDPQVMAAATYALTRVVEVGSGEPASHLVGPNGEKRPAAGKTGTSNGNLSAWFAGYVPQLATVVGLYQYDLEARGGKGEYMQIAPFGRWKDLGITGMTGGSWPASAWADYMTQASKGMEVEQFPAYTMPLPEPTASPSPSPSPSDEPDEMVVVPDDLIGQLYVDATAVLTGVRLMPERVDVESDQPSGTVLFVEAAGEEVERGSTIRVDVSEGFEDNADNALEETSIVPTGLIGEDKYDAEDMLEGADLEPEIEETPSEDVQEGDVISVNPGEGSRVPKDSEVTLLVSTGPEEEDDDGGLFG